MGLGGVSCRSSENRRQPVDPPFRIAGVLVGAARNAYSTWTRTTPASKTGHAAVLVALGAASEQRLLNLVLRVHWTCNKW